MHLHLVFCGCVITTLSIRVERGDPAFLIVSSLFQLYFSEPGDVVSHLLFDHTHNLFFAGSLFTWTGWKFRSVQTPDATTGSPSWKFLPYPGLGICFTSDNTYRCNCWTEAWELGTVTSISEPQNWILFCQTQVFFHSQTFFLRISTTLHLSHCGRNLPFRWLFICILGILTSNSTLTSHLHEVGIISVFTKGKYG